MKHTIRLPNKAAVTVGVYAAAWRTLKQLPPDRLVSGFDDFPMEAGEILGRIRFGVHDRINRHLAHPAGRDGQLDLRVDRDLIEAAIHRRTFRSGTGLLRTRYLRKRYPHLNSRHPA